MSTKLTATIDFTFRLIFFAAAPFVLVFVAALFPITGALVQIALVLGVFFAGEAARALTSRSTLARVVLRRFLAFEEYYRAHPPKPFFYYVFYPLLFPYWLWVPEARREFILFKGYTVASFLTLLGGLGAQLYFSFLPQLGLKAFLPIALGTFVIETMVVLMFLMPIVTTVVHYHVTLAPRRLAVLLLVAMTSIACASYILHKPRDPVVSFATRTRVRLRTKAKPADAQNAQELALRAALKSLPHEKGDVDSDGKVEGLPLESARIALTRFYKTDEAYSFDLWLTRRKRAVTLVLYFEARGDKAPIWLALDETGAKTHDPKKLPKGAFGAMKLAADAVE